MSRWPVWTTAVIAGARMIVAGDSNDSSDAPLCAREAAAAVRAQSQRLLERGEIGEALELASSASKLAADDAESWLLLGSLHALAGHEGESRSSYEACVRLATRGDVEACRAKLSGGR